MQDEKKKQVGIAGKVYGTSDYQQINNQSQGLAVTHEQASDSYTEGTIDEVKANENDKNATLNQRGYQ